jgi:TPR repeat protein
MGVFYASGQGVRRNIRQSMLWFRKAAEHGHPVAAYNLGVAYATGLGVPRNGTKAYMWHYIASSVLGYAPSKRKLDQLEEQLAPAQIAEALRNVHEWVKGHPNVKPVPL